MAAALLLAIFGLMMWKQSSTLRRNLDAARAQLKSQQAELAEAREVLDLIHSPDAMHKTLVALKTPPQPQVKTIYSPQKQRLLLVASNMESLPAGKVYELWLLPANGGAPVPAGTFTPDARGNAIMDHALAGGLIAKEFAITVENEGGSPVPTTPVRMVSAG
jgi:anti-sigma-K factor RskA